MTSNSTYSAKVVEFMTLFSKVQEWSDDDPNALGEITKGDDEFSDLCSRLFFGGIFIETVEKRNRKLFTTSVDPKFVENWRKYQAGYQEAVSDIVFTNILSGRSDNEAEKLAPADRRWDNADWQADERSKIIESAIEFAYDQATQEWRDFPEGFREGIEEGVEAWEGLKNETGFDLRGVFRRRELIPFVLVPRQVAAKHGNAEKFCMLKILQQAHDAFVFGAKFAALALMRSIMEAALRDHYGVEGRDLNERINNARTHLPRGVHFDALHRLRKRANAILHLDREKESDLPEMDEVRLEKEIHLLLLVLRNLIEGAPKWPSR